jgi:hypothetical protein
LFSFFRFCLPFLPSLLPMLSWFRPTAASEPSAALAGPVSELPPYHQDHALAAFEQGDWLAELELLQLANALQRTAITRVGYDGRSFDLMFAIADVLESDHGWSFEQSDAWLERMGLWEEEV